MARNSVAKKVYVLANGEESSHAQPGVQRLEFRFGDGQVIAIDLASIGASCREALTWHGLSQKVGDAYASKGDSTDDAYEAAMAVYERLQADDWMKPREAAGPRISVLVEAIVAAKKAAGQEADAEAIAAKCKDKAYRDDAKDVPEVKAQYDRILAERAVEQAAKSANAADTTTGEGVTAL